MRSIRKFDEPKCEWRKEGNVFKQVLKVEK
jgi:hypothetical protein